jgi:hypothetical protein
MMSMLMLRQAASPRIRALWGLDAARRLTH